MLGFMSSISQPRTYSSGVYVLSNHFRRKYSSVNICKSVLPSSNNLRVYQSCKINLTYSEKVGTLSNTMVRLSRLGLRSRCRSMSLRMPIPSHEKVSKFKWNLRRTLLTGGSSLGLFLSFSASGRVNAESSMRDKNENASSGSSVSCSHGKKVYTDYSITGIPGDGRCLFRSVAHGACIRSGKPLPNEALQRELADNLRERVADEFVKRRAETEWFVEGDFDAYVSQIRKPHVWGGEPELFMASHVLQMPITVYMHDEDSGGLISIAEYGQEYGKDDPIQVLYHGFGHYDALHIPGKKGNKSRL